MKRLLLLLGIFILVMVPPNAWPAGSCTQSLTKSVGGFITLKFACTGDSSNGSIPDTAVATANMAELSGNYYLYTVSAYPTSEDTAPDAADVFILDANGEDLLGSTDGGTTANKGANLIHATLKNTTLPYSNFLSTHYFPPVTGTLTLRVANQETASASYTVELVFVR